MIRWVANCKECGMKLIEENKTDRNGPPKELMDSSVDHTKETGHGVKISHESD